MVDPFIINTIIFLLVIAGFSGVWYRNFRQYLYILDYLRSQIAPDVKITNARFGYVCKGFPVEIGLSGGGKFPISLRITLTGQFPKQKLFMYDYPELIDHIKWSGKILDTSIPEIEWGKKEHLAVLVTKKIELMVNLANDLQAKNA